MWMIIKEAQSQYKEEFAGIKRKFYDTYFEYRFIYNLRNYMVHESLGILKVNERNLSGHYFS